MWSLAPSRRQAAKRSKDAAWEVPSRSPMVDSTDWWWLAPLKQKIHGKIQDQMLHAKKHIHKFPYLNSWMPDAHFGAADSWWKTGLPVVSFIHLHQETQRGPLRELFPDGGMDGFTGVVQLIVTWQKFAVWMATGNWKSILMMMWMVMMMVMMMVMVVVMVVVQ